MKSNDLLGNEDEKTPVEVYFDDFKVTQVKSPVVQTDDYYPFGLTFNEYTRENSTAQHYLYNGKERQDDLGLGLYDYIARQYDPAIGRFLSIDPAASGMRRFSPYAYAFDNPIRFTDPDGMLPDESTGGPGDDKKKKDDEQKKQQQQYKQLQALMDKGRKDGSVLTITFKSDATRVDKQALFNKVIGAVQSGDKGGSLKAISAASTANDVAEVGGELSGKFKTPPIVGNTLFGIQAIDHLVNEEYGDLMMDAIKFGVGKANPIVPLMYDGLMAAGKNGLPEAARQSMQNVRNYEALAIAAYKRGDVDEYRRLSQIASNERNAAVKAVQVLQKK